MAKLRNYNTWNVGAVKYSKVPVYYVVFPKGSRLVISTQVKALAYIVVILLWNRYSCLRELFLVKADVSMVDIALLHIQIPSRLLSPERASVFIVVIVCLDSCRKSRLFMPLNAPDSMTKIELFYICNCLHDVRCANVSAGRLMKLLLKILTSTASAGILDRSVSDQAE